MKILLFMIFLVGFVIPCEIGDDFCRWMNSIGQAVPKVIILINTTNQVLIVEVAFCFVFVSFEQIDDVKSFRKWKDLWLPKMQANQREWKEKMT